MPAEETTGAQKMAFNSFKYPKKRKSQLKDSQQNFELNKDSP